MKHTRISTLFLLAALGGVSAALVETAMALGGRPIILPPITLPIALAAIGVIIVVLALPIRRMIKGTHPAPVDPFYATRVLMLAKASSLSGSLLFGIGIGVAAYLLTRSIAPAVGSLGLAISTIVGAGVLLAAGLIAEHMCKIPPGGDDDDKPGKKPVQVQP